MLRISRRTLYIVITPEVLSLRYIVDEREVARFEEVPQIAIGAGGMVRGGSTATEWAQMPENTLFCAFQHPRVAVDNFELTVKVLKWFLTELNKQARDVGVITNGIFHYLKPSFLPLTDIEKRTLEQAYVMMASGGLVAGIGNTTVSICQSREGLTPSQVQAYKDSANG